MSENTNPAENGESIQPARADRVPSGQKPRWRTRSRTRTPAGFNLSFECTAASVPTAIVADSPLLLVAVVEVMCWRVAVLDWSWREPRRSDKAAHTAWQSEVRGFSDKSARIREMVDESLMAS